MTYKQEGFLVPHVLANYITLPTLYLEFDGSRPNSDATLEASNAMFSSTYFNRRNA